MSPWESQAELQDAATAYSRNWWRTDADAQRVLADHVAHPGLATDVRTTSQRGAVPTTDIYKNRLTADGRTVYLPERVAIHDGIVGGCVPEPTLSGPTPSPRRTSQPPTVYFTIGGPGAGKSSYLRGLVQRQRGRLSAPAQPGVCSLIDADTVRRALPEYAEGLGSLILEPECYDVTYGPAFDAALALGEDIVYDTIGRLDSIHPYLERLRRAGYEIHMVHAAAPATSCQDRAERRAVEQDGRIVLPGIIRSGVDDSEAALRFLVDANLLTGWATYDTTDLDNPVFVDGTEPWTCLGL